MKWRQISRDGELNMYANIFGLALGVRGCCCQLRFHTQESKQVSVVRIMNSTCTVCIQSCCRTPKENSALAFLSLNASLRNHLEEKLIKTEGCIWCVFPPCSRPQQKIRYLLALRRFQECLVTFTEARLLVFMAREENLDMLYKAFAHQGMCF